MNIWIVLLIIAVVIAIVFAVLYFVGNKMQKKQEEQRAQLDEMAQTVSMLVIDKKRMKMTDAGFPKMIIINEITSDVPTKSLIAARIPSRIRSILPAPRF